MKFLPQLVVTMTALLPLLQTSPSPSPDRRNSKRMSIFDAIPDSQYRSGRTIARARSGRQIQPLTCVSKGGSDTGVCMFAWNCVEAGGKHLGTCIDRFYFGSCCKLPDHESLPQTDESINEIPDAPLKPLPSSTEPSTTSTSTSTTTTTTTTTPTTTTTTTTIKTTTTTTTTTTTITTSTTTTTTTTSTPSTTSTTTTHSTTTSTASTTTTTTTPPTTTTTSADTTTTTTTPITTTTTSQSTSTTEATTEQTVTVDIFVTESSTEAELSTSEPAVETTETPAESEVTETPELEVSVTAPAEGEQEDIWVLMKVGADGVPQVAPGYEHFQPQSGQMYNCSELGDGLYNCTVVDGPTSSTGNCSIVTSDLTEIQKCIENTGGATKPATLPGGSDKPEPSAPTGSVVSEVPDTISTINPSPPSIPDITTITTTEQTEATETSTEEVDTVKPLDKMSYKEVCGRTPWLNETFRNSQASPRSGRSIGETGEINKFWRQFYRQPKIVNGEKAKYGEWPWQVSLRQWRTATFLHKCGAALLSENWAITAAHCVEGVNPDELLLRMGEYDLNDEFPEPYSFQDRKVQIVASHPKFDPKTFEYDLALLRFYEPVSFQPNIIPICVPEDDADLVGKEAWVTGWGRLYEDGPLPAVLQEVSLPIINNTECEAMYEKAGFREHIPHIFICAGYREGGKDSCEGDSGGPMSVYRDDGRYMLSGVISWGIGCAERNQPGVYTRISEFRDWVNQILQY